MCAELFETLSSQALECRDVTHVCIIPCLLDPDVLRNCSTSSLLSFAKFWQRLDIKLLGPRLMMLTHIDPLEIHTHTPLWHIHELIFPYPKVLNIKLPFDKLVVATDSCAHNQIRPWSHTSK